MDGWKRTPQHLLRFFPKQFTVRGSQFFLKMCPPFSAGHAAFLFLCLPQFCRWWCPPSSAGHGAFLFFCLPGLSRLVSALFRGPCNIYSFVSQVCHWLCPPLFLWPCRNYWFVSQVCHWWCPPFSAAFLFICLPGLLLVMSALFRWAGL